MKLPGVFLALLLPTARLLAQGDATLTPPPSPAPATASTASFTPLTLSQSYTYTLGQMFGPSALFRITAVASRDQYDKDPDEWKSSTSGYAERVASRFGLIVVRENVAFAVRALDHEDPRYLRSGKTGFWRRVGYAAGHTFMPAWSTFLGEYSAPFIAQQWRPDGIEPGRELRSGTLGIGLTVVQNLGAEFWPDVKKKMFRR